jgi:hypothetical protein
MALSRASRYLTFGCAALYTLLGAALFLAPARLSPVFAWKVSDFVAMTIGAWCLGNAWSAFMSARFWRWDLDHPALIYLWVFGLLEMGVLLAFRDKLRLEHPIAWLYLLTLGMTLAAGIMGVIDLARTRPRMQAADGLRFGDLYTGAIGAFILFGASLGLFGLLAPVGIRGTNAEIFPEIMSAFTLRSFGAFYLALALGAIPLLFTRSLDSLLHYSVASYGLIVIILLAAVRFAGLFDFAAHPYRLAYWGAYIVVGMAVGAGLIAERQRLRELAAKG